MRKSVLICILLGWSTCAEAEAPSDSRQNEQVVRALIEAGNRSDVETWLSLFHPDAKQFLKSESEYVLADRPSSRIVDAASRRSFYEQIFAQPQKTQGEIREMISLGELVMARGVFHRPGGRTHTLTTYRIRDGKIMAIWDVEQVAE